MRWAPLLTDTDLMNEISYFTTVHHGVPLSFEYGLPKRQPAQKPRRARGKLRLGSLAPRRRPAIA